MIYLGSVELNAVLFDLDGTLVHTKIDFPRMYREMRTMAQAVGVSAETLEHMQALEIVDAAVARAGEAGSALKQRMFEVLEEIEHDGSVDPEPAPGARELFAKLHAADVNIGIVTRNCRAVSLPLLDQFGLDADIVLTRDDVVRTKPNPEHLRLALEILGVDAANSAMVGDHWLDVKAGQEAGCAATIGVLGEQDPSWFATFRPTYTVQNLEESLSLFNEVESVP